MPTDSNDDDVPARAPGGDPDEYVDTEEWRRVHQSHYDHAEDGEFVATLVSAVADAKGVDPFDYREMPPLYDSFDTETLEETFFGQGATREERGTVTFAYAGSKVALRSDGWIFVYEPR